MLVTMTHPSLPGVEKVVDRDSYRYAYHPKGWRSLDDPSWSPAVDADLWPYLEVPGGWGEHWRAARRDAGVSLARVGVFGDSIAVGWDATDWRTKGWAGLLTTALQSRWGNGGTGFYAADFARHSGNNLISGFSVPTTGEWTTVTADGGINGHAVRPSVDGNGATMAFTVDCGTTLSIWSKTDPAYGRYDYQVDAGPVVQVPQNVAVSIQRTDVAVAEGTHTVTITAAAGQCRIFGVSSERTTGVVVHNLSRGGRQIDDLPTTVTTGLFANALTDSMAVAGPLDLAVVALGVNDCQVDGRTTQEMIDWLSLIVRGARDTQPADPPDVALMIQHRGKVSVSDLHNTWPSVVEAIRSVAATWGAAVIDMWRLGRSWEYWEALGYWGGTAGDDAVHPNDAGHAVYAAPVIELVTT